MFLAIQLMHYSQEKVIPHASFLRMLRSIFKHQYKPSLTSQSFTRPQQALMAAVVSGSIPLSNILANI